MGGWSGRIPSNSELELKKQNLLFAVAQCTVEKRSRVILTETAAISIKIFAYIIISAKMI